MTKRSYTEAVLAGIEQWERRQQQQGEGPAGHGAGPRIAVRLLLSIDRREGEKAARDTVRAHNRGM